MKKALLLLCIMFLYIGASAQTYKIRKTYTAKYDPQSGSYVYDGTTFPENMKINMKNGVVYVNDNANSNYTLGEQITDSDKNCITYMTSDEKNRVCGLRACNVEGQASFTVIYPDEYYIIYYVDK